MNIIKTVNAHGDGISCHGQYMPEKEALDLIKRLESTLGVAA